jgi:hypothetical protein
LEDASILILDSAEVKGNGSMPSLSYIYPHRCAKIYSWIGYEIHLESGLAYGDKFTKKRSFWGRSVLPCLKPNFGWISFYRNLGLRVSCTFSFLLAGPYLFAYYKAQQDYLLFPPVLTTRRLSRGVLHVISGVEA